jgi:hypothetical protein
MGDISFTGFDSALAAFLHSLRNQYCRYGGYDMRDRNGVWLNGASTISALLYGDGDFVQTVRNAFNFGWDADNNAAASGAILGVIKGYKSMMAQGWEIKDRFHNTSRDNVPEDETITSFGDRLIALAQLNLREHGGSRTTRGGKAVYRIPVEKPANVEAQPDPKKQYASLRSQLRGEIEKGVTRGQTQQERARAAYLAICLDFAPELKEKNPDQWAQSVVALNGYPQVLQVIFYESPIPAGKKLPEKAVAAGVQKPAQSIKIWV